VHKLLGVLRADGVEAEAGAEAEEQPWKRARDETAASGSEWGNEATPALEEAQLAEPELKPVLESESLAEPGLAPAAVPVAHESAGAEEEMDVGEAADVWSQGTLVDDGD